MKMLILNSLPFVLLCAAVVPQAALSQNTASNPSHAGAQANTTGSHQPHDSSFRVAEGSVFHVVLAQNLDAKKNKTGHVVTNHNCGGPEVQWQGDDSKEQQSRWPRHADPVAQQRASA